MPRRINPLRPRRRPSRAASEATGLTRTPTLDEAWTGDMARRRGGAASGAPDAPPELPRRSILPGPGWKRRLLVLLAIGVVVLGVLGTIALRMYSQARIDTVGDVRFARPLAIPPLLEPRIDADGRRVFDLQLQQGRTELLPGTTTTTWGANGTYLGPTLHAARGDRVAINVANGLPETTTLHWHGMHLPAHADGGPHQMIEPGQTWSPAWTIDQPAATLWYHPHLHGRTADHVYRGLAGMFLVEDDESVALPDDYGIDDIPVVLQDKRFDDDGALDTSPPFFSTVGVIGDEILVNGTYGPYLDVTRELVRLRVLNASNGRVYNLQFDDRRQFHVVGTDGGLLDAPVPVREVQMSPGERVEIVVRLRAGDTTVLRSESPDMGLDGIQGRFSGADDRFDLLQLRAADDLAPSPPLPDELADVDLPAPARAVETRTFELRGRNRINGRKLDMGRIDTVVTVDTTEIWEVTNRSGNPHNFHVHDVQFSVLDVSGGPLRPELTGRKDTVFIPPRDTVRVAVRFTDYTDASTPYMYHCHVLAHEDAGMMGQFVVVEPGETATPPDTAQQHHAGWRRGDDHRSRSVSNRYHLV